MKATGVAVGLVLAMVGCKKGGGDACRSSMEHASTLVTNPPNLTPEGQKYVDALKVAGVNASVKRCTDDHWSADITTCITGAKTNDDTAACLAKLPPGQKDALDKDIDAAAAALQKSPPPPAH